VIDPDGRLAAVLTGPFTRRPCRLIFASSPARTRDAGIGARLFVWLQYLLPQHALSRLVLAATRVRTQWFKNALTRGF
jgi:hypothetical protein